MIKFFLAFTIAVVAMSFLHLYWTHYNRNAEKKLKKWAEKKGYALFDYELRHFKTGPYFFSDRRRTQPVFYVVLEDKDGNTSKAWIKTGGYFGFLSNGIEVRWENKKQTPSH